MYVESTDTTVTLAAHARRGLDKTLGELRMRDTAIDGLGYLYAFTRGLPFARLLVAVVSGKSPFSFSGSRSSEAAGIANRPPRSL